MAALHLCCRVDALGSAASPGLGLVAGCTSFRQQTSKDEFLSFEAQRDWFIGRDAVEWETAVAG